MEFKSYSVELEDPVKAFNMRLRSGGERYYAFPESNVMQLPKLPGRDCYEESFLLMENGDVRGGYILRQQKFCIGGTIMKIGVGPQLPISEGIVNPSYIHVGVLLLQHALQQQPFLCEFGIGGVEEPYARLLKAGGWTIETVPFLFRVTHPDAFFANLTYLRQRRPWGFILDLLRFSSAGSLLLRTAQLRLSQRRPGVKADTVSAFESWADDLWESCKTQYSFLAVRDSATLNLLYRRSGSRFLRVSRDSTTIGWAVALATQMSDHRYFGNMHVGSIVDCLALPDDANSVIRVATEYLLSKNVDIIVTNQSSSAWRSALIACGFLTGPSNFLFGMSRALAAKLEPVKNFMPTIHVNRGDGDGPINL